MRSHLLLGATALLLPSVTLAAEAFTGSPDPDGKYWIHGEGIAAAFVPYGASISNLIINDQYGIERDIVTGFDNASYYHIDKQHPHFGGVPGRYANRIKNSTFKIDGESYHIIPNENPTESHPQGLNTLHGGPDGWDWRDFNVTAYTANSITFSIVDPDGKEGFPGEVVSYITYSLGNLTWDATMIAIATTKKTPIMLSSHTYWNLDGFANNQTNLALDHELWMPYSGQRVAVDNILIPTGEILSNPEGSVNDFWSKPKRIGDGFKQEGIEGNCGFNCTGYDNCWLVNRPQAHNWRSPDSLVARLHSPWSGIQLDIFSNQEAFQMYSCNFQDGTMALKSTQGLFDEPKFPRTIPKYGCVVLEVQDYIDGINHPEWGRQSKQIFEPAGDPYVLQVRHKFSIA
ncbi:galactose mutarotase-like domain-containing protein [Podospora fimiseda]|uniref:Galactose mutarotase-like domain-containing protein n=1 Tax=Podospora fimiseda TaxID=252190 RepID=A0AAN7BS05_9PEZI|nr:galactose mutarotase-like domain-containing protein [Podospora fimiseda]